MSVFVHSDNYYNYTVVVFIISTDLSWQRISPENVKEEDNMDGEVVVAWFKYKGLLHQNFPLRNCEQFLKLSQDSQSFRQEPNLGLAEYDGSVNHSPTTIINLSPAKWVQRYLNLSKQRPRKVKDRAFCRIRNGPPWGTQANFVYAVRCDKQPPRCSRLLSGSNGVRRRASCLRKPQATFRAFSL